MNIGPKIQSFRACDRQRVCFFLTVFLSFLCAHFQKERERERERVMATGQKS